MSSALRKWSGRGALVLLGLALAAALVLAGELALRLLDVGHGTTFLVPAGRDGYTTNPRFTDGYFPAWYEIQPAPALIPAPKPPGTYRIFVLGGSAAFGDLLPEYSMARMLAVLLRDSMDKRRYEVINAAALGVNSRMAVDIARDVARHQPDLLLVYSGNNEVVGPGGPGALLESEDGTRAGAAGWLERTAPELRFTRMGQLLQRLSATRDHPAPARAQPDMRTLDQARVALDDPRLQGVYQDFRAHLMQIIEIGRDAGAEVMLCTVATNLTGQPPLASMHRGDLEPAQRAQFDRRLSAAVQALRRGPPPQAVQMLLLAAALDDRYAELHFRLGRALMRSGQLEASRSEFLRALDLDAQRYRADTEINRIIREVAAAEDVMLMDAEAALAAAAASPAGLPGNELFYDHVHLNFDGNYTVARGVFDALQGGPGETAGREAVAAALALTDWDRLRARTLIERRHRNPLLAGRRPPPYDQDSADLREPRLADVLAAYRSALEQAPQDLYLRRNLGWLLRDLDQPEEAVAEFEQLVRQTPNLTVWRTELATLLLQQERWHESVQTLRAALRQDPGDFRAHRLLGQALAALGDDQAAVDSLRRALRLHPYLRDARMQLAQLLLDLERYDEAIPQLEALLSHEDAEPGLAERLQQAREKAGQQP